MCPKHERAVWVPPTFVSTCTPHRTVTDSECLVSVWLKYEQYTVIVFSCLVVAASSQNLTRTRAQGNAVGLAAVGDEFVRLEAREGADRAVVEHFIRLNMKLQRHHTQYTFASELNSRRSCTMMLYQVVFA